MSRDISILVVDDHRIIRDGLRMILEKRTSYNIFDCSNGQDALQIIASNQIQLVIVDLNMKKGINGVELTAEVKKSWPDIKVLVFSMNQDHNVIKKLMKLGIEGYLLKDSGKDVMLMAIETILSGEFYYCAEVTLALTNAGGVGLSDNSHTVQLTDREIEILLLIAEEFTNKEIGEKLSISSRTVDAHRRNLIEKIGARNTAGLVRYAIANNLEMN